MSDDGEMDEAMAALEQHLGVGEVNVFDSIEPCMDYAEFAAKLKENKTKLIGLTATELSDAEAKTLVSLIVKATSLEGISLDGTETSATGTCEEIFSENTSK